MSGILSILRTHLTRVVVCSFITNFIAWQTLSFAQSASDPAASEEIEAARLRLLKAIDEIENVKLSDESQRIQLESLYKEIQQLKEENRRLRSDLNEQQALIQKLRADLERSEKSLNAQREVLVNEVSRLSVEAQKKNKPSQKSSKHTTRAVSTDEESLPEDYHHADSQRQSGREYYVHEVKKGQTLFSIVQAYRQQGATDATLEEVLEENNLKKTDTLVAGQKIYIPKAPSKR
ncbi:MAG: LysM peptidoglycan-binding domain-containing protein [Methylacidiphilales bacterium]|nr:LysM peptidoglycan-binding domain-containing protein [Candidatus Methylacidiphilales bacterium]MDW8349597.1 LysM peptidoglycan-binding domain-containing protein [Verrucomicrobiae bacterium]